MVWHVLLSAGMYLQAVTLFCKDIILRFAALEPGNDVTKTRLDACVGLAAGALLLLKGLVCQACQGHRHPVSLGFSAKVARSG